MSEYDNNDPLKKKHVRIALILALACGLMIFLDFIVISLIYSWADWVAILVFSMLFIVPAYISNAGMVFVGGGKPIDRGKFCKDGRRILGDHKTINGLVKGPLYIGIPISIGIFLLFLVLWPAIQQIPISVEQIGIFKVYSDLKLYEFYFIGGPFPIGLLMLLIRIIFVSYGASLGDLAGSFIKRRLNYPSGAPFWIVDQLDFALGAILFSLIPVLIFPGLYIAPDLNLIIFLMIITPSISIIANTFAYIIGWKDVPW
jgi:CDP-2,3-bis-(O-geranylgeranyl)-sn-glycerol synthase